MRGGMEPSVTVEGVTAVRIQVARGALVFDRPLVCGVVNVTPDSFSDAHLGDAVAHARQLVADGADWLDIGGESTRPGAAPGAAPVDAAEETRRVVPVIEALAGQGVPLAVDTTKAAVAQAALAAGAWLVNDVSGGRFDPAIVDVTAAADAGFICGHVRGTTLAEVHAAERTPPTVAEVTAELRARVAGLPPRVRGRTVIDPSLGFGKRGAENFALLAAAGDLARACGAPIMVGPSRKRFLAELAPPGAPPTARDPATIGACLAAIAAGAHVVRVHAVAPMRAALDGFRAVAKQGGRA